jgi:hypothetical protein
VSNRSKPKHSIIITLWVKSGGDCAFPHCDIHCIVSPTNNNDSYSLIGDVAHIYAYSNKGPRPNPQQLPQESNEYDNLILLCRNHHKMVDDQVNAYPVSDLKHWKMKQETVYRRQREIAMGQVGFTELDLITKAFVSNPTMPKLPDFTVLSPLEKMKKNNLSDDIRAYIELGLANAAQVAKFVEHTSILHPAFPDQLVEGFSLHYRYFVDELKLRGDELFYALLSFVERPDYNLIQRNAGLAVLIYLFHRCDLFEI